MSDVARLKAIRDFLRAASGITKSSVPDAKYAERYVSPMGMPIVLEPRGLKYNRIWVRVDSVSLTSLDDIENKVFIKPSTKEKRPNHDLYPDPLMQNVDLICYHATTFSDAKRVIDTVINVGATP